VLNDVWFYGMHRLLHTEWLFKRVHSVHHRSVDVSPFTSYSFHPLEGLMLTAWVIPTVLLLPIPLPLLGVVQVIGLLNNVNAHLGYELQPRWFVRVPPFSWLTSSTFHNLHHAQVTGNYGLMLRVWDRVFGTERAEYAARFLARGKSVEQDAR
jgi:sterol desaturase/sphingolipid hydroxylase (fatty acid hydroxylase superfamily)